MVEKRKVCLIGATGVGKSSLVTRFVRSIFSDAYRTTIGVKIETRRVSRPGRTVDLVIWDLSGEDEFQNVPLAYLRGASGILLVVDGTRRGTVDTSLTLLSRVSDVVGAVPFVLVVNKSDLAAQWEVEARDLSKFSSRNWPVINTSARTGAGVEAAFEALVDAIPPAEEQRA